MFKIKHMQVMLKKKKYQVKIRMTLYRILLLSAKIFHTSQINTSSCHRTIILIVIWDLYRF